MPLTSFVSVPVTTSTGESVTLKHDLVDHSIHVKNCPNGPWIFLGTAGSTFKTMGDLDVVYNTYVNGLSNSLNMETLKV